MVPSWASEVITLVFHIITRLHIQWHQSLQSQFLQSLDLHNAMNLTQASRWYSSHKKHIAVEMDNIGTLFSVKHHGYHTRVSRQNIHKIEPNHPYFQDYR